MGEHRKIRRFDKITRYKIFSLISTLHESGNAPEKITEALEKAGHRMTDGSAIPLAYVTGALRKMANEGKISWDGSQVPAQAPPYSGRTSKYLPEAAVMILTDPTFSAEQKVKILLGMANV